jgi:hypothetical protein
MGSKDKGKEKMKKKPKKSKKEKKYTGPLVTMYDGWKDLYRVVDKKK